jgi:PAS domain S-box-containing protein
MKSGTKHIAEHCQDLNFIVDRNYNLEYATRTVLKQFGTKHGGLIGKPFSKVLSGEYIENLETYIARVLSTGKKLHRQDEVMNSGEKKWYDTLLTPLKSENGSVNAVMVVSRDITDLKRMEEEIRNEGIRQIEKHNEQLLILNDKIRNPLQVIKSLMELDGSSCSGRVLEQIALIDSIVSKLDQGWLESEMVRKFLIEHYHHGQMDYTGYKGVAFDQGA